MFMQDFVGCFNRKVVFHDCIDVWLYYLPGAMKGSMKYVGGRLEIFGGPKRFEY